MSRNTHFVIDGGFMDLEFFATASRLALTDESIAGSFCFPKNGSSPSICLFDKAGEEDVPDCEF